MSANREKSALIAMSGGVDSSVAAWLMREQGYRCEGTTMRLYRNADIGLSVPYLLLAEGYRRRQWGGVSTGYSL